jgi:hypothetical protein
MTLVEGVDLRGVNSGSGRHLHEGDHVARRPRFDAHGPDGNLSLQFLHPDPQQAVRLVAGEDIALTAATPA